MRTFELVVLLGLGSIGRVIWKNVLEFFGKDVEFCFKQVKKGMIKSTLRTFGLFNYRRLTSTC